VVRAILESLGRLDEYEKLSPEEKSRFLLDSGLSAAPYPLPEKARETMDCLAEIKEIQSLNGEAGCNRYIISNCSR
jgi:phosphoenolpyruvate carboxylase